MPNQQSKKIQKKQRKMPWSLVVNVVVIVALVYIVYSQWGQFARSFSRLSGLSIALAAVAFLIIFATYMLAALQYKFLAIKHIKYRPTWVVQMAGAMANRILPAGLGGLGLSADYLHRNKHSLSEAGVVAGTNNLLGIVVHVCFLSVIMLVGGAMHNFALPKLPVGLLVAMAVFMMVLVLGLIVFPRARSWLHIVVKDIKRSIAYYEQHPWRLVAAACIALCVSACFILALQVSAWSLGVYGLTFGQFAVIMTLGVLVGTATPTPGGVVGAEAGLAAGLIAYGVPHVDAIAVAILYRVVSYWVPLVMGSIMFVYAQKKRYI
ncbi:MAG: lysylphosphatidylglycerol synthase transmembrane domain-containing protein [Candidatus Saccharimonadales bacterium]